MGKKQWNEIIYLVSTQYEVDEYGREIEKRIKRKARADKSGSYASEYTAAGQNDIKLTDFMFTMRARLYHGETLVEYKGNLYGVYRTYPPSDDLIELHLTDRAGLYEKSDDRQPSGGDSEGIDPILRPGEAGSGGTDPGDSPRGGEEAKERIPEREEQ